MRKWSSISVYASRKIILIKTTDKDIAKTALLAKGFREAGQTVANAFRTFADKTKVDYSQKEQKHPITRYIRMIRKLIEASHYKGCACTYESSGKDACINGASSGCFD